MAAIREIFRSRKFCDIRYVGPMGAVALVEGDVLADNTWRGSASFLIITMKFLVSVILKEIIHLKAAYY